MVLHFFFFQAEDGIRDGHVTGVQTCALPISAREHIPIYLAAVGPRNCALAGEIADGWLGIFFAPEHAEMMLDPLREGRTRVGADLAGFDVATSVAVSLGADVETSAEPLRDQAALYVGDRKSVV